MHHNSEFFLAASQDDIAILTLVNTANTKTNVGEASKQLRGDLTDLLNTHQPAKVLIDFAGLRRIGSIDLGNAPMIAILLAAKKRTAAYSAQWRFCGMPEEVRARYELARLDTIFPIHPTQAEAIAAFQSV